MTTHLDDVVLASHPLDAPVADMLLLAPERGLVDAAPGERRRRELAAGRAAARLALRAAGAPAHLCVLADAAGRPRLDPPCDWHVSIAHDGRLALAAASLAPVGVDVVPLERASDVRRVVEQRVGSGRAVALAPGPRPFDEWLMLWTAWEALGKRTGGGVLSGPMSTRLTIDVRGEHPQALAGDARVRWLLVDGHLGCVAGARAP